MNPFESMVEILSLVETPVKKIDKRAYNSFRKEYVFYLLKGLTLGSAFCEVFNIQDAVLSKLKDQYLVEQIIEEKYLDDAFSY